MKNGYVKLSVQEYNELMIESHAKSRNLEELTDALHEKNRQIEELTDALQEKSQAVDNLARTQKHTVDFLEAISPKMEKEWRAYIKAVEEDEK